MDLRCVRTVLQLTHVSALQDGVFQDLGEGILENALQVVIIVDTPETGSLFLG